MNGIAKVLDSVSMPSVLTVIDPSSLKTAHSMINKAIKMIMIFLKSLMISPSYIIISNLHYLLVIYFSLWKYYILKRYYPYLEDDDEEEHLLPVLSRIPEDTGGCGKVFGKVKGIFKGKRVKR